MAQEKYIWNNLQWESIDASTLGALLLALACEKQMFLDTAGFMVRPQEKEKKRKEAIIRYHLVLLLAQPQVYCSMTLSSFFFCLYLHAPSLALDYILKDK